MKKQVIIGFVFLFLIQLVFAQVVCNPSFISVSYEQGDSASKTISCTNNGNNSVSITKLGDFSIDSTTIGAYPSSKTINISFNPSSSIGFNSGKIQFNGIDDVFIFWNVEESEEPETQGCVIDIFPSILSNIKIQQGETKTRNIQLSIPNCYSSPVTVNGIALQTDEKPLQLGEISIGTIQPGNSVMIPIEINAIGVSTGSYSDLLQFLLYDNLGNKINVNSVSISVMVTQGISPITNFSLTDLPTCSIDAIDLAINQTYTLTCSRTNPNIDIEPMINYLYIRGLSVSETPSQYIYSFAPKIIGETMVGAKFKYKNAELGSPYVQNVRISPSGGSPVGGITTKFAFYQGGVKKEAKDLTAGDTIIQILDNSTGNVLTNYKLYINGLESNNTIILNSNQHYELRSSVPSYLDNVINFTVSQSPLTITITPSKEFFFVNEIINITSNQEQVSILVNNVVVSSPYTLTEAGNKTIEVVKSGYESANTTIVVKNNIVLNWNSCTLESEKWKKGKEVTCGLNQDAVWTVYSNGNLTSSGQGKVVDFKIEDFGWLEIKADDIVIASKNIVKKSLFGWVGDLGYWWILIFVVGGLIVYFLFVRGKGRGDEDKLTFVGQPQEE